MPAKAAVCHVSTDQVITQPPARRLLAVPKATDLPSALRAINILQQNFQILSGQTSPLETTGFNVRPGQKQGRYTELDRVSEEVRVFNKDDSSQFIDVLRINTLVMRDNITGETWNWSLKK